MVELFSHLLSASIEHNMQCTSSQNVFISILTVREILNEELIDSIISLINRIEWPTIYKRSEVHSRDQLKYSMIPICENMVIEWLIHEAGELSDYLCCTVTACMVTSIELLKLGFPAVMARIKFKSDGSSLHF